MSSSQLSSSSLSQLLGQVDWDFTSNIFEHAYRIEISKSRYSKPESLGLSVLKARPTLS